MGKGSTAKQRPARDVINKITNCELPLTNLKRVFECVILLCVICAFTKISFGQDALVTQEQVELLPFVNLFQKETNAENIERKRDALFQIRNMQSEEASRTAIPALKDSEEIIRATAAFSVIFLPKPEAAQILVPLLRDKSELVRRETAYALGKVGNPDAINALVNILRTDKSLEVRAASAIALGEIGDASAIDELLQILRRRQKSKDEFLRRSAARSIGQIAQIIRTNKVQVITPENFLPDKYNPIEKPTYKNLLEAFPIFRTANASLIQVLQNPKTFESVKRETAFALGEIADESAIPVLQSNLNAKDYYLAEISRESLRKIAAYLKFKETETNASSGDNR